MAYPSYPRFTGEPLAVTNPIGFADDIASLGNLIDALSQRRIQNARQEEKLALQRRDLEIAQAREARQDAQGMRKSRGDWMKHNVDQERRQRQQIARGMSAEPMQLFDQEGNPVMVNPEEIPFTNPPPPPIESGVDLPPLPPGGPPDIDSALQGAGGAPGAPELPPTAPKPPIETLQGTAPGPETMAMLDALPFHGKEQLARRKATEAPPPPPQGPPGPPATPPGLPKLPPPAQMGSPQAGSVAVPPPVVRGASFKALPDLATVENLTEAQMDSGPPGAPPQAPRGKQWRYRAPGGDITIDQEQARNDLRAQREFEAEGIRQQLANPNLDPHLRPQLERDLAVVIGGIPPKMGQTILAEAGKTARQQTGIESQERMQGRGIESREGLAADKNKTAIEVAKMRAARRGGRGGGGATSGVGKWAEMGEYQKIFASDPRKASYVRRAVMSQINSGLQNMNWNLLQGKGVDRLDMAMRTIQAGGTGEFEAMMNFFGYIRGGVPAENETKEWHRMTDNTVTMLDKWGQKLRVGAIGTLLTKRDLTEQEKADLEARVSGMAPGQRAEMIEAIKAAQDGIRDFAQKNVGSIVAMFDGLSASQAEKEIAQGKIDQLRMFAGLPDKDDFGVKAALGKLRGGPQSVSQPSGGGGSSALEAAVNKLLAGKKPAGVAP